MNNKGFTLVEIMAMLVVLGIIMVITVPNITGILSSQKRNLFINDAEKLVESAKTKMAAKSNIKKISDGQCLIFTLNYLDANSNFNTTANDGKYYIYDSFVVVKKITGVNSARYEYYVRLVEGSEWDDANKRFKYRSGIVLNNISEVTSSPDEVINDIKGSSMIKPTTTPVEAKEEVNIYGDICSDIVFVYTEPTDYGEVDNCEDYSASKTLESIRADSGDQNRGWCKGT